MQSLGVTTLYVRFFDVDWDAAANNAYPVQALAGIPDTTLRVAIVPTIFITNRTLIHGSPKDIPGLAERIAALTLSMASSLGFPAVHEVQLDCDWTEKTRGPFFDLAGALRRVLQKERIAISATIRLHQVKYLDRSGVPPVDRGVLMFYNMGELNDPASANSILDLDAARKYLPYLHNYPLPLDVALPLYSWGVVYRRARVAGLMNNVTATDFSDETRFAVRGDRVEVLKDSFFNYRFLYTGDVIRLERVPRKKLDEAASLLARSIDGDSLRVIFYHLDSQTIRGYRNEDLQAVCAAFGHQSPRRNSHEQGAELLR